ncbi:MAG TPA: hypothetical protein VFV72_14580 [Candidatus Limnocylindrales bacterium]|nr:hypothetical protein [Candidatus Limnocylindrales bacterium]
MSRTLRAAGLVGAILVTAGALIGPAASRAAAADGPQMTARVLLQGHARLGSWLAIEVELQNEGAPVTGELRLQGGAQGGTRFSMPVDLPSPSDKRFMLYAQPPSFGQQIEVLLVSGNQTIARQKVAFTIHDPTQLTIGVVAANPSGIVSGIQLPAVQNTANPVIIPLDVADLPDRIEAWSALDRLIWQDVDSNTLTSEQVTALRGWLALGGRLIVVGGTAGPGVLSGFPDAILPYRPATTLDVAPASLAALLAEIPDGAADVPAMSGELLRGRALVTSGDRVVAADAAYGGGGVTVIGLDPTVGWIAETQATVALWRNLIPARTGVTTGTGDDTQIVGAVSDLPALQLPPIGGLVLLLLGYIALIGPINYLVLRRLDKREWAWVTMPALIAIFAAGAYAYGAALRGSDIIVNEVAIVRGAPGATEGAAQVYLGVFSPTRGTYQVALPSGALLSAPVNGDFFGGQGTVLDVVQGQPARVRNLAVGFGSLRTVRAETQAEVPLITADLELAGGVVSGTIRNDSTKILESPAIVLGSSVVVLPDIAPAAMGAVNLRVATTAFQTPLSDKVVGQVFFNDAVASNDRQRRNQTRHRIIDQLTYDPMFGNLSQLPSDVPVLLAWGRDPVVDVEIEGQRPTRAANVLYYIPVSMRVRGATRFGTDLVRSTVISADAGFFTRDPYTMSFGKGTVTLAYRPIPFDGTFTATKVLLGMGFGGEAIGGAGGKVIEPVPAPPEIVCIDAPCESEAPVDPNAGFDGLPETEVFDRTTSEWRRLPHLSAGSVYDLKDASRYVDPSTGTIQVRFVNERNDPVGMAFNVVIEGTVE